MIEAIPARLRPAGFTALALAGTWLGHSLEYARVAGVRGFIAGLSGPVHGYMPVAGAALLAAALLFGAEIAAGCRNAERRTDLLRQQLRSVLRGHVVAPPSELRARSSSLSGHALFCGLAIAQIALYAAQENLEAAVARSAAPGIGAISGTHWMAPLIQVAVAALLTVAITSVGRLFSTQAGVERRTAALIRYVTARLMSRRLPEVPAISRARPHISAPGQKRRAPPFMAAA